MSDPAYIYPEWIKAKRELINGIWERYHDKNEILNFVDDWLENHLFEFGASYKFSKEFHAKMTEKERLSMVNHYSAAKLVDMILEKGMYYRRIIDNNLYDVSYETRIVVCGAPRLVGPATRKP